MMLARPLHLFSKRIQISLASPSFTYSSTTLLPLKIIKLFPQSRFSTNSNNTPVTPFPASPSSSSSTPLSSFSKEDQTTTCNLIEIERKFKLREVDLQTIKRIAIFGGEKTYNDEYFDNSNYELTKKDTWLRKRNGTWECKVAMDNGSNKGTDYYLELTNDNDILKYLLENKTIATIDPSLSLEHQLANNNVSKFASIHSTRSKYKTETFSFDLDVTDFGYSIGEIEIMVKNTSEIPKAQKLIDKFVSENGLVVSGVQGKVLEYLSRFRKEHYEALVSAGLIGKKIT